MAEVIFTQSARLDLSDYGILVPMKGSRPDRVRAALTARFGDPLTSGWGLAVDETRIGREDLLRVHTPRYVDLVLSEDPSSAILTTYELVDEAGNPFRYAPWGATRPLTELVRRALVEATGTLTAAETALEEGFCHFLGGGMHHALADEGRGFCLTHDVLVVLRRLQAEGRVGHAWIIDTDCHKGDGTAALTLADPTLSTFSIHMARGWPLNEPPLDDQGHLRQPFWPSTVDRGVPLGGETHYLPLLRSGLLELDIGSATRPDLAIVVAGSDTSELDVLPSAQDIRLPLDVTLARDRMVYEHLRDLGIPQAWVMAGGYGDEVWRVHAAFLETVLAERRGDPRAPR